MPKFVCSYAHDIPAYADFVVEAESEAKAQDIIEAALDDGRFDNVYPEPCFEGAGENQRVFVQGAADKHDDFKPTLDELVSEANK